MKIDGTPAMPPTPAVTRRRAETPEEAARQFEAILVRQFVDTMTDGLFEEGLSAEDGPGWMSGQRDAQRDALADVLTQHLVERGVFRIADLLLRQWTPETPPDGDAAPDADAPRPAEEPPPFTTNP